MMLSPVTFALGTMTSLLSGVRIWVTKMPTSSTTPVAPPASTKSPTLQGLKSMSSTPAAKLASEP